jgi:hypothetical protein
MNPRRILMKSGVGSPLRLEEDHRVGVSPDEPALALSHDLAVDLRQWSQEHPEHGEPTDPHVRRHARDGLALGTRLAAELGPAYTVLFHDQVHQMSHSVCWQCGGFHWRAQAHEPLVVTRTIQVIGEYKYWPLRFAADADFAPDDPVVGLGLSETLVDELYAWSRSVDDLVEAGINPAARSGTPVLSRREIVERGESLSRTLADELGNGWTVEYARLAH